MKNLKKVASIPTDTSIPQIDKSNSQRIKFTANKAKWTYRLLIVSVIQGAIVTFLAIILSAFIITTPYKKYLVSILLENHSICLWN
jgi:hypothetical protein